MTHPQQTEHTPKNWHLEVLRVSLPLVISTSTTMVMEITDRIFLARHSLESIAAATPAGLTAFLFISFFMGVGSYVNVFIAQHTGAGRYEEIGRFLWQGIYFSLLSSFFLAAFYWAAEPIFAFSGHRPEVQRLEVIYFRILCIAGGWCVLESTLSGFYSGQGLTRPVMFIHLAGALINIPMNYALINGLWIFPELGIAGAGLATAGAWVFMSLCFCLLIFNRMNDRRFGVFKKRYFDRKAFIQLLYFGGPSSLQFSLDIFAFTVFVLMVGRIGTLELAVTNMVISINSLAFMPMVGFSIGVSTLVGQVLGNNRAEEAVAVTRSTIHIVLIYIACVSIFILGVPEWTLSFFKTQGHPPEAYATIERTGVMLLRFVAAYIFFDALYMIYLGVLKGAGDTHFIMWSLGGLSLGIMVAPLYAGIVWFNAGLYFAWTCTTLFIASLFLITCLRYRQGRWKNNFISS